MANANKTATVAAAAAVAHKTLRTLRIRSVVQRQLFKLILMTLKRAKNCVEGAHALFHSLLTTSHHQTTPHTPRPSTPQLSSWQAFYFLVANLVSLLTYLGALLELLPKRAHYELHYKIVSYRNTSNQLIK